MDQIIDYSRYCRSLTQSITLLYLIPAVPAPPVWPTDAPPYTDVPTTQFPTTVEPETEAPPATDAPTTEAPEEPDSGSDSPSGGILQIFYKMMYV